MKTGHDIIDIYYSIINVDAVNSLIDGKIYRHDKPVNSKLKDIVINCLPVREEQVVLEGAAHINMFAQKINGMHQDAFFRKLTEIIVTLLEAYVQGDDYFDFEKTVSSPRNYYDQPLMSIASIRLDSFIQEQ